MQSARFHATVNEIGRNGMSWKKSFGMDEQTDQQFTLRIVAFPIRITDIYS